MRARRPGLIRSPGVGAMRGTSRVKAASRASTRLDTGGATLRSGPSRGSSASWVVDDDRTASGRSKSRL